MENHHICDEKMPWKSPMEMLRNSPRGFPRFLFPPRKERRKLVADAKERVAQVTSQLQEARQRWNRRRFKGMKLEIDVDFHRIFP